MKLKLLLLFTAILALTTTFLILVRNRIENIEIYDGDEKTTFRYNKFKENISEDTHGKEKYYTTDDLHYKITENFIVVTSHKTEYYFTPQKFYITYK